MRGVQLVPTPLISEEDSSSCRPASRMSLQPVSAMRHLQLAAHDLQRQRNALPAQRAEPIEKCAPGNRRARTQRLRLEDVLARSARRRRTALRSDPRTASTTPGSAEMVEAPQSSCRPP